MFDTLVETTAPKTVDRLEVHDHVEMGRLVAYWAVEEATRPRSLSEARQQMRGIASVPEHVRRIAFCQHSSDTLHLRLPARAMVEESVAACLDPLRSAPYPLPAFYADQFRPGLGPVLTPFEMLLARLGDDAIARCR